MHSRTKWLVVVGLVVAVAVVGGCRKSKPGDKARGPAASQECRDVDKPAAKLEPMTVRVIALKHEPAGAAAETVKELLRCEHFAGVRQNLSVAENGPANAIVLAGASSIVDRLETMVLDLDKAAGQRTAARGAMNRPMADGMGQMPMNCPMLDNRGPGQVPGAPGMSGMPMRPGMGPMSQPGCPMMKPGLGMKCPICGQGMICPFCSRRPMMGRPGEAVKPGMPMSPGERFKLWENKRMERRPDAVRPGAKKMQQKSMNDADEPDDDAGELEVD